MSSDYTFKNIAVRYGQLLLSYFNPAKGNWLDLSKLYLLCFVINGINYIIFITSSEMQLNIYGHACRKIVGRFGGATGRCWEVNS